MGPALASTSNSRRSSRMFVGPALGVNRQVDRSPRIRTVGTIVPARRERADAQVACYTDRVGRLENIIARNRRPKRMPERVIASMVMGAIVLLIILLAVFTDLGVPPGAGDTRSGPGGQPPAATPRPADGKRVDGI